MTIEREIAMLVNASAAYYAGEPSGLSDEEFDRRWRAAREAAPDHPFFKTVGAPPAGTKKARHLEPMGSLENIMDSEEDLKKWHSGILLKKPTERALILQHKVDGASIELVYDGGHFIRAVTRGDGTTGEDVTANVKRSRDPMFPRYIETGPGRVAVLAEAVIFKKDFKEHFAEAATARAAVAGTLGRKNGMGSEHIRLVAYSMSNTPGTELSKIVFLEKRGFRVATTYKPEKLDKLWFLHKMLESERDDHPYEIDGTVVKLDEDNLGSRDGRPYGQRAIKFPPRGAEAECVDVEWQVGMRKVTPVLKVKPVKIDGVTIASVTLHNWHQFKELLLEKGDIVRIVRSGDVIPMIAGIVKRAKKLGGKPFKYPNSCPKCGRDLEIDGRFLVCGSDNCAGRTTRIVENWCRKRNILALGPAVIAAIDGARGCGGLTIDALYGLDYKTLSRVETESESGKRVKVGKNAQVILDEIEKSRDVTFADFFGSLGIPGIGRTKWRKIAERVGKVDEFKENPAYETFVMQLSVRGIAGIPGFTEETAKAIIAWLNDNEALLERLEKHMRFQVPKAASSSAMSGEVVCFTGDGGMKRDRLTRIAIDNGATVRSTVTGDLTLLVCADMKSLSSKARKAREKGVMLMSAEEFLAKCVWDE